MKRLASLSFAAAVAMTACGANTPDTLRGRWTLTELTCDGAATTIPTGLSNIRITYGDDNALEIVFSGSACAAVVYTGTYQREGLTVKETLTQRDCGISCGIPELNLSACSGVSAVNETRNYRVDLATEDELLQGQFTSRLLCSGPPAGFIDEQQSFRRLN